MLKENLKAQKEAQAGSKFQLEPVPALIFFSPSIRFCLLFQSSMTYGENALGGDSVIYFETNNLPERD